MLSKALFASRVSRLAYPIYERTVAVPVRKLFFADLIRHTNYFHNVRWLGNQVFQNVLDLWTVADTIAEVQPALIIESGTYQGGSALFYASVFDLLGQGHVITIDIEKLHDHKHPRIEFWIGDSTSEAMTVRARTAAQQQSGPVMVILDSNHAAPHVKRELEAYSPAVTPGSYLLAQDGVIDALGIFRHHRPGPMPAIREFLREHQEFEVDLERSNRFLITHHPSGWLRRRPFS
jgi:cephalosporin hydroxylase